MKFYHWLQLVLPVTGLMILFGGTSLAAAAEPPGDAGAFFEAEVIIEKVTEEEILTDKGTFLVPEEAAVYGINGQEIRHVHIVLPAAATVLYEQEDPKALPVVVSLSVEEELPKAGPGEAEPLPE